MVRALLPSPAVVVLCSILALVRPAFAGAAPGAAATPESAAASPGGSAAPAATGARGLPPPGATTLKPIDPKVPAFETELLAVLNKLREKSKLEALRMDEKLRAFARHEAELAATGSPLAAGAADRIKQQNLAPNGHYVQFGYGQEAARVAADLTKDANVRQVIVGDFQRVGIGAFLVPEEKPYFQYTLLLVRDPDPMAGKPGLSPAQTDPVMQAALPRFKECYDASLKENPNLRGDVVVQIVIGAEGTVESTKMLKSLRTATFDTCAINVAARLKFPAPYKGKPVTLNHPMRFTPPQGDKRVGRLQPSQIEQAFGQARLDFRACYDARAKEKPGLAGAITLGLTVGVDGVITALDVVHDEIGDAELQKCVLTRARQVRFPVPEFDASVELTYPVRFEPSPAATAPAGRKRP